MDVSTTLDNLSSDVTTMAHQRRELSTQGVMVIGSSDITEHHTTWTAEGMAYDDEHFSIYPLSESDLYLCCDPALQSEETASKKDQTPLAVRFVFPKVLPKVKGNVKNSKRTYVSPRFSNILNVALGHRFVSDKSRKLSNMIDDLFATKPTVTFLEPTPDDTFLPYAETVFNNLTTAFSHFASRSKGSKQNFPKTLKHIRVVEKDSDSNIVKFDKDHLTIFAAHKGKMTSIADMINGLDNTMGKGLRLSEGNLENPQLAKFTVEGYQGYIPSEGADIFNVRVSDYLGAAVTDSLLNKLARNKLLTLTLPREGLMEKHSISIKRVSKESQTPKDDDQTGKDKAVPKYILSVCLNGRDLCQRIKTGKAPNQVTLVQRNPTLLLLPRHDNICMGSGSDDTTSHDKGRHGNLVRYIDFSAVEFELSQKATFRMSMGSLKAGYSNGLYAFRMPNPKPLFIRARCKVCKSFLELHSKTCRANPGEYLQVCYEPHSKR